MGVSTISNFLCLVAMPLHSINLLKEMKEMANKSQEHDKKVLHNLGYAQELSRRMSGFSNFAISFSIICILAGGISAFPAAFREARLS